MWSAYFGSVINVALPIYRTSRQLVNRDYDLTCYHDLVGGFQAVQ